MALASVAKCQSVGALPEPCARLGKVPDSVARLRRAPPCAAKRKDLVSATRLLTQPWPLPEHGCHWQLYILDR